jgi:hypothetical protein
MEERLATCPTTVFIAIGAAIGRIQNTSVDAARRGVRHKHNGPRVYNCFSRKKEIFAWNDVKF